MAPEDLKLFQEWQVPLPTREAHGTETDVRGNLKSLNPTNWRLQGNRLIADTDVGEFSQIIPPTQILTGTDEKGLPTFKKL